MNNSKPSPVDGVYHGARGPNHGILDQAMQTAPCTLSPTALPDPTGTGPRGGYCKDDMRQAPRSRTKTRTQITGPSDQILKHPIGESPHFHLLTQKVRLLFTTVTFTT